jgi:hypothetical protein
MTYVAVWQEYDGSAWREGRGVVKLADVREIPVNAR